MAYLVKKRIYGKEYYYLRESKRINGKVKTRNLAYFGKKKPTKQEIEKKLKELKNKEKLYKDTKVSKPMLNIEEITKFCRQKGFIFQNSEIYGGNSGFFDYGPLGVELKNNIKNEFWKTFVTSREDIVGIDGAIITNPKVWEASGHVKNFIDYIYECKKCKILVKGDNNKGIKCPKCKSLLKNPKKFNLMFKTAVGPSENKNIAYLRPETAQLIFINFKQVMETSRKKLPFGIAQIGKAFRNEISPRDFLFRMREFEQAEIEFFVHPDEINDCPFFDEVKDLKINFLDQEGNESVITIDKLSTLTNKWHAYWLSLFYSWFLNLGIKKQNLRIRQHKQEELAHYAKSCFDIEYKFPFGWKEIHGNADRQQFDLKQHTKFSKKDLSVFDEKTKTKIIPYVASEPSQGIDRAFLAFLFDAYSYDEKRGNIVLKLNPKLAPIKVAVFPLVNKLNNKAREIYELVKENFNTIYDKSGSIGRRYARADEIGIPFCITIDFQTLDDNSVTIRNRDTTKQIRVKITKLKEVIDKLINNEIEFEKAGKPLK